MVGPTKLGGKIFESRINDGAVVEQNSRTRRLLPLHQLVKSKSSDGGVGSFGMFVHAKSSEATFRKESDCPVVVVPIYHGTATSPPDKEEEEEDWEWVQWK